MRINKWSEDTIAHVVEVCEARNIQRGHMQSLGCESRRRDGGKSDEIFEQWLEGFHMC